MLPLRHGASLERLANKDQVNATEEGDTLECGRDKVWQACTVGTLVIGPLVREPWLGAWL